MASTDFFGESVGVARRFPLDVGVFRRALAARFGVAAFSAIRDARAASRDPRRRRRRASAAAF